MTARDTDEIAGLPPVRLCCGHRHVGALCPDGYVLCCLCFERVTVENLAVVNGQPEDVCQSCADQEAKHSDSREADRG